MTTSHTHMKRQQTERRPQHDELYFIYILQSFASKSHFYTISLLSGGITQMSYRGKYNNTQKSHKQTDKGTKISANKDQFQNNIHYHLKTIFDTFTC